MINLSEGDLMVWWSGPSSKVIFETTACANRMDSLAVI